MYETTNMFLSFFICAEIAAHKKGDVNNDDNIDISDVVAIINVNAGRNQYKSTANVNGNDSVDISDIVAVINIIANGASDEPEEVLDAAVKAGLCLDNHHPHAIDLRLDVKWAYCNVGASAPWEHGGYYAWGETEEKDSYTWDTYIHCNGNYYSCKNLGSDISGTQFDVAREKWGGSWCMPSYEQQNLLLNNCSSKWTSINNINGRMFTAPNGGTIFLPATGLSWYGSAGYVVDYGNYWSSTQCQDDFDEFEYIYWAFAYYLFIDNDTYLDYNSRNQGFSIRPVL